MFCIEKFAHEANAAPAGRVLYIVTTLVNEKEAPMTRSVLLACAAAAALVGLLRLSAVADSTPTAAPATATVVHIKNFAYVPPTITVKAGDTVSFVNDDSTPHTVTASDKSFDSGNMDQNATWKYTYAKAGTYAYICTYHPYMKGTVVVKDASATGS
jgi:plastocyanin